MAKNEKFLTIDIGATSIKLCEFELDRAGQMTMSLFAYREYEEELSDDTRQDVIEGVLRQMLMENNVKARKVMLSLSGQSALIRFGKINIIKDDRKLIRQLAEFEAKRNIPFALDQISLDYQLIAGSQDDQENRAVEVMSIIVKNDIINMVTQVARNVGLKPILIDVAPVASYNAARANNIGESQCELLVSIGGRSTNLMFIEGEQFFARTIPIAGYSITQQIAKEFGIAIPEAEELKRHHGYVALSSTVDDTSDAANTTAANVSKIIRNVMTRLYGEISRSINIYRAQQHGSAPVKIYLTGGSSILTYCDTFFSDKFKLPVEYFNALRVVNLSPEIDRERLGEVAHMLGETVGLGFRYTRPCPIEINLLPKVVQRQQNLTAKVPYFVGSMACIAVLFAIVYTGAKFAAVQSAKRQAAYQELWGKYERPFKDITDAIASADSAKAKIDELQTLLSQRAIWPSIIEEIYRAKPDNVWIDSITPIFGEVKARKEESVITDTVAAKAGGRGREMGGFGGLDFSGMDMMGGGAMGMEGGGRSAKELSLTKQAIGGFIIKAHTVRLSGVGIGVDPQLPPEPQYPFSTPEPPAPAEGEEDAPPPQLDQSGESLFVRNLRKSRLFSSEELMTTIVKSGKNRILTKNTLDFEIQLKLDLTVEAYPWPFPATSSGGSFGRSGDGLYGAPSARGRNR